MGRKKIYQEELLKNNPFVESPDFEVRVRNLSKEEEYVNIKDISDGVILTVPSKVKTKYLVEAEAYTKVYNKKSLYLHIADISPSGKALFLYIQYHLQHSKDYIRLEPKEVMKQVGYGSINTFKKSLEELVTHLIITPTLCQDVYWINPVFFFNGSRISKYGHKIKETR